MTQRGGVARRRLLPIQALVLTSACATLMAGRTQDVLLTATAKLETYSSTNTANSSINPSRGT